MKLSLLNELGRFPTLALCLALTLSGFAVESLADAHGTGDTGGDGTLAHAQDLANVQLPNTHLDMFHKVMLAYSQGSLPTNSSSAGVWSGYRYMMYPKEDGTLEEVKNSILLALGTLDQGVLGGSETKDYLKLNPADDEFNFQSNWLLDADTATTEGRSLVLKSNDDFTGVTPDIKMRVRSYAGILVAEVLAGQYTSGFAPTTQCPIPNGWELVGSSPPPVPQHGVCATYYFFQRKPLPR